MYFICTYRAHWLGCDLIRLIFSTCWSLSIVNDLIWWQIQRIVFNLYYQSASSLLHTFPSGIKLFAYFGWFFFSVQYLCCKSQACVFVHLGISLSHTHTHTQDTHNIHTHIYIHVYTYWHSQTCMLQTYTHTHTHTHTRTQTHTHKHTRKHTHTLYVYIYIIMHNHT